MSEWVRLRTLGRPRVAAFSESLSRFARLLHVAADTRDLRRQANELLADGLAITAAVDVKDLGGGRQQFRETADTTSFEQRIFPAVHGVNDLLAAVSGSKAPANAADALEKASRYLLDELASAGELIEPATASRLLTVKPSLAKGQIDYPDLCHAMIVSGELNPMVWHSTKRELAGNSRREIRPGCEFDPGGGKRFSAVFYGEDGAGLNYFRQWATAIVRELSSDLPQFAISDPAHLLMAWIYWLSGESSVAMQPQAVPVMETREGIKGITATLATAAPNVFLFTQAFIDYLTAPTPTPAVNGPKQNAVARLTPEERLKRAVEHLAEHPSATRSEVAAAAGLGAAYFSRRKGREMWNAISVSAVRRRAIARKPEKNSGRISSLKSKRFH